MLAKVTRGNQVTIPKEIAKKAHIRNGNDYVDVSYDHGVICLKPVDIEYRIPEENYRNLLKKAVVLEKGDVRLSAEEAKGFLRKIAKH
ncbi:MAG: hypothetical protein A3C47_02485 [Omnitrophica bacterium RIFCSPHIGHO2_02_FULL_51_18]|nr:MAG: hypothetical protein A3C47_02485 [Omnitrophica bacterium RIFCSPHIGHO2_02_FULL_51_18]